MAEILCQQKAIAYGLKSILDSLHATCTLNSKVYQLTHRSQFIHKLWYQFYINHVDLCNGCPIEVQQTDPYFTEGYYFTTLQIFEAVRDQLFHLIATIRCLKAYRKDKEFVAALKNIDEKFKNIRENKAPMCTTYEETMAYVFDRAETPAHDSRHDNHDERL